MALIHADLVEETTTTTGTGTLSLAGATAGNRTFVAGVGSGNTVIYGIKTSSGQYEIGIGTVTDAATDTLSRDTLIASSTGAALNLPSGTHTVYCTWSGHGAGNAYSALQPADIASGTITPATGDIDLNALATGTSVYVSSSGNDTNDGLNALSPKLTIGSALTAAVGLTPSASKLVVVWVLDAGVYTENISMSAYVHLYAPSAKLVGSIIHSLDSSVVLKEHQVTGTYGCTLNTASSGVAYYTADRVTVSAGYGFANINFGALLVNVKTAIVSAAAYLVQEATGQNGHLHYTGEDVYLDGAATGFLVQATGATIQIQVAHILQVGATTGGTGLMLSAGSTVASVQTIGATTAWSVSGGTLDILVHEVTGTKTATGGTVKDRLNISTFGASLIDDADAATARATLGLGTAATTAASAYEPADATILKDADIGTSVQAYDADTAKLDTAQTWTAKQTFGATAETWTALSGTTPSITAGSHTWTLSGNSTPTDGLSDGDHCTLMIDDGTASTISWISVVDQWDGGSAPDLPTTGYLHVVLWKVGTTVYGAFGQGMS